MARSALASLIVARNATPETLRTLVVQAFADDARHLADANNGQPLADALAALPMGKAQVKGAQNKALGDAIALGVQAMREALPNGAGWIGAVNGPFSKASKEARTPYLEALAVGVEAFRASIDASEAFADKVKLTPEERAAKKAEREAMQAEENAKMQQAAIQAAIDAGQVVPRDSVRTLADYAPSALIDAIASAPLTADDVEALQAIVARHTQMLKQAA